MTHASVKTIIFDLGGVYFSDGTEYAIGTIAHQFGLDREKVSDVFKGEIGTKYRKNVISHENFWRQAKETLGINAPTDELANIWLSGYVPIQGTVEIVKELKTRGYELLFLSDNVQERIDYLTARYNFLDYFKDGVFSHKVGTRKPDINMYRYALEKTTHAPNECVYIDDKENLLEPARTLGLHVIHFISPEDLRAKLIKFVPLQKLPTLPSLIETIKTAPSL